MMTLHMTDVGPVLSPEMLAAMEASTGVTLPPQVAAFLLSTNGGKPNRRFYDIPGHWDPVDELDIFLGVGHATSCMNLEEYIATFAAYVGAGVIPVATTETGSFVCVLITKQDYGSIVHIDIADPLDEKGQKRHWRLAPSFDAFCDGLRASVSS